MEQENSQKKKSKALPIILGLIVVAAIVAGVLYFTKNKTATDSPKIAVNTEADNIGSDAVETDSEEVELLPDYTPSQEFAPVIDAMSAALKKKNSYDVEETIRILGGLEEAQANSKSSADFLEYMARQDYSRVAPDAIKAKAAMLPVIQKLIDAEKNLEDESSYWNLVTAIAEAPSFKSLDDEEEEIEASYDNTENQPKKGSIFQKALKAVAKKGSNEASSVSSVPGEPVSAAVQETVKQIFDIGKQGVAAAFTGYANYSNQTKSARKLLDSIRIDYCKYLEDFYPVYYKYQLEWDRLCLKKDQAYLGIYSGNRERTEEGLDIARKILKEYPENRETLLLKSAALIKLIPDKLSLSIDDPEVKGFTKSQKEEYAKEADEALDKYLDAYPSKSAPALLLKGFLNSRMGNEGKAMAFFDQAAMEYPRQAEALKDMMDLYKIRNYLNKTVEGKYLLKLYHSTMEGCGLFSPNLQKAIYYESVGKKDKASEEIFRHFYRRKEQGIYDEFVSDMEFCETNLYPSFRSSLLESSFLSVKVEGKMLLSGINVYLDNNSDVELNNIRLFICLHMKDSYPGDYEVFACPSINKLPKKTEVKWPVKEYSIDDIVSVRAILMTDDKICWVDNLKMRIEQAEKELNNALESPMNNEAKRLLALHKLNDETLVKTIKKESKSKLGSFSLLSSMISSDKNLEIRLPRMLCMLDPIFLLGEEHEIPESVKLDGKNIVLNFEKNPDKLPDEFPLYIVNSYKPIKITVIKDKGDFKIKDIEYNS